MASSELVNSAHHQLTPLIPQPPSATLISLSHIPLYSCSSRLPKLTHFARPAPSQWVPLVPPLAPWMHYKKMSPLEQPPPLTLSSSLRMARTLLVPPSLLNTAAHRWPGPRHLCKPFIPHWRSNHSGSRWPSRLADPGPRTMVKRLLYTIHSHTTRNLA